MYAIVLTFDGRLSLAELVLKSYQEYWPDNPFTFRIPYCNEKPDFEKYGNVELIKTDTTHIKNTIQHLLKDIPDNDFTYWCFDDIYLRSMPGNGTKIANEMHNFVKDGCNKFDSIKLIKFSDERMNKGNSVKLAGCNFYQKNYNPWRFWYHQYIKCSVLKNIFVKTPLPDNYSMKDLEKYRPISGSCSHQVFLPEKNLCTFAETTRGPYITQNCLEDLKSTT